MIEKMKFLSITGPKEDIDRVVDQYLSKYEIQIENALSELKTVKGLRPYIEINPYKDYYQKALKLAEYFKDHDPDNWEAARTITVESAVQIVNTVNEQLSTWIEKKEELYQELETLQSSYSKVVPFLELDYDISSILHFQHIRFRFGRIPKEYYAKFENYVYESLDTILYKCHEDETYITAVYFVPASISKKIDAIYASLHFERFFIPDEYQGTPTEASNLLRDKIDDTKKEIVTVDKKISKIMETHKEAILLAHQKFYSYNTNFNVRKLAACTKQETNTFYILCGWMTEKDALAFQNELKKDENTFCLVEDNHNNILSQPPTKLKNPRLFHPFEMFIKMYGLPAYNEMDPTILIGITYAFLFGFMFGDVGQGLCLMIGGFVLYQMKKADLAAIISCCGFFSTFFGFMFGSIFGFEDLIPALWIRPANQMISLPFIGKLNIVFAVAIALGMGIIILTMVLNIINSLRQHNAEKSYFDTNGMAGLVFYSGMTAVLMLFMTGRPLPATGILVVMFIIPLLIIFFKEPLTALVTKDVHQSSDSKAMFFVQGFFELFEVLLSYFSNTLSFVRVGAFAVSHAAMMNVVLMLAGVEAGNPNWLVVIFGNLFVCGMEGLIVGIQVLRLEYYEIFSRFYKGSGREFKPYGK